jgi:hypothetical protein
MVRKINKLELIKGVEETHRSRVRSLRQMGINFNIHDTTYNEK